MTTGSSGTRKASWRKLFGTDGVRGRAGVEPMTGETVLRLAMAAAQRFTAGEHRHLAVVGKDTRLSGYMLEPALTAGLAAMGMDVALVGPMPTPAIALLTRSMRADLGVMISASHNPFEDNGIKLFGPDGYKLSDATEAEIEAAMAQPLPGAAPDRLGRVRRLEDASGRYIEAVKATFPRSMRLEGMRIVVDCANGAAHRLAPAVFHELGAEVIPIGVAPDGLNINAGCGATSPEAMCRAVLAHGASAGVALDGDADRVIMCDEHGRLLDGDQLLGLIAADWHAAERVRGGGVVATVMSNLGLEHYLRGLGLGLFRSGVGDRYVLEMMLELECNLGGEQSGHMLLSDHTTTGDGVVAALQVLAAVVRSGRPVSESARVFEPLPQRMRSVRVGGRGTVDPVLLDRAEVQGAIRAARARLGQSGRVLVRKSGTEPVVRVMAEGEDLDLVDDAIGEICAAVSRAEAVQQLGAD